PTKTHILNLLHRLIDPKKTDLPEIDPPDALALETAPKANVDRYDDLRQTKEKRHAS
ncbi:IS21 family transposase, partial [Celeribacter halophilus]|nr:IS21 family transposase [Celeribacter halophilus]